MTLSTRRALRDVPVRLRARHAVAPVAVAGLLLALSGCSATNPMTTMNNYQASDGVRTELGAVVATNLLVLSSAAGAPGTMIGALSNHGRQDLEVTLSLAAGEENEGAELLTVSLGAGESVILGPDHEEVEVEEVPTAPGTFVDMILTSDREGSRDVRVPVLDGTLPEYAELVPQD